MDPSQIGGTSLVRASLLSIAVTIAVVSCGGGAQTTSGSPSDLTPQTQHATDEGFTINVAGIKGPLAGATATLYKLDTTRSHYFDRNAPIVSGITDSAARASTLRVPGGVSPPFVLVVDGRQAIDLNTGAAPVIVELVTLITDELASSGRPLFATPLTTLAYDMAVESAGTGADSRQVVEDTQRAAKQIVKALGFGLSEKVDIFADPPILDASTTSSEIQEEIAHHRAVIEAVAAIAYQLGSQAGVTVDSVLPELARDLGSDGVIDARANDQALPTIDLSIALQEPATLKIPGTSLPVTEVVELLRNDLTQQGIELPLQVKSTDIKLERKPSQEETDPKPDSRPVVDSTPGTQPPGAGSNVLNRREWSLRFVDSQETSRENGIGSNAFDGDPATVWRTEWSTIPARLPHEIQIDTGTVAEISGLKYLPPQDRAGRGRVKDFQIYVSDDGNYWGAPVSEGRFSPGFAEQLVEFSPVLGRYVRFVALSEASGQQQTAAAEITLLGKALTGNRPPAATIDSPAADLTIAIGDRVSFTSTSFDVDGDALDYRWTFGDAGLNAVSVEDPGLLQFNKAGSYTVTLIVSDAAGNLDPTPPQRTITVIDHRVPRSGWTLHYVDSEETTREDGRAVNAFDGDINTFWHSRWSAKGATPLPHKIQIDLGAHYDITGLRYLPRQDGYTSGMILDYALFVSDDGMTWSDTVLSGSFNDVRDWQRAELPTTARARYVQLVAVSEQGGKPFTSIAELELFGAPASGNLPPVAAITSPAGDVTIIAGQSVAFAGSATDGDNDSLSYSWNFGGSTLPQSTVQTPGPITFTQPGTYRVTLEVMDNFGNRDSTPPVRTITVGIPPTTTTNTTTTTTRTTTTTARPTTTTRAATTSTTSRTTSTVPSTTTTTRVPSTSTTSRTTTSTSRATTTTTRATTTTSRATTTTTRTSTTRASTTSTTSSSTTTVASTTTTTQITRPTDPPADHDDPVNWADLVGNATGQVYLVGSQTEFNNTAAMAQPGDVVIIKNGTYNGWKLRIPSKGTARDPIIYTAQTPGGVTFTGLHQEGILVTGHYNIVGGFSFKNCGPFFVRFADANKNRFTDSTFVSCGEGFFDRIIEVTRGSDATRIDHISMDNSISVGVGIYTPRLGVDAWAAPTNTRVDHNSFKNVPRSADGGREPIQIGPNTAADKLTVPDTFTVIEHNEFINIAGQVINSKTGREIIRFNRFVNVQWEAVSMRLGHYKVVEGNYFEDVRVPIQVYGEGHKIINNIIVRAQTGILMPCWGEYELKSGKFSRSPSTGKNLIAHNTIVNGVPKYGTAASSSTFELGRIWGFAGLTMATNLPFNNIIVNNILVASEGEVFEFFGDSRSTIENNIFYAKGNASIGHNAAKNLYADPRLTVDYRPTANSPAVDSGVTFVDVKTDANGDPRPNGAAADLGAYEWK